jgi:hypothetical protein
VRAGVPRPGSTRSCERNATWVEVAAGSRVGAAAAKLVEGRRRVLRGARPGQPADMFNTVKAPKNLLEAMVLQGRLIKTVLVSCFRSTAPVTCPAAAC